MSTILPTPARHVLPRIDGSVQTRRHACKSLPLKALEQAKHCDEPVAGMAGECSDAREAERPSQDDVADDSSNRQKSRRLRDTRKAGEEGSTPILL